jgi:hypothetical protein
MIGELAAISTGYSPKPIQRQKNGQNQLGGRNISDGHVITRNADAYINDVDQPSFRRAIAKPGDIIVSTLFNRRKLCVYRKNDLPAVVNSSCAIIRAGRDSDYIISYLESTEGEQDFIQKASHATRRGINHRVVER